MKITIRGNFRDTEKWLNGAVTQRKAKEVCKRLCNEVGQPIANFKFRAAAYDGTNDASVTDHAIKGGHCLETEGNAALFIEYGAGVYYNGSESYPDPEGRPSDIDAIGEYGHKRGRNDYWFYPSDKGTGAYGVEVGLQRKDGSMGTYVRTFGNPAAAPMYYARVAMADEAQRIFDEEIAK